MNVALTIDCATEVGLEPITPLLEGPERARLPGAGVTSSDSTGRLRVLIVEDEPAVRNLVSSKLDGLGYEVTAVASGPEALHLLSLDHSFDLLFTDVMLPGGVSGIELARRVRRAFGFDLKVVLTSGYPRDALAELGQPDADVLLLQKPYRGLDLEKAVQEALGPDA